MSNKKTARRAFYSSLMALFLCFAMLLGTTFAWFTDTAKSGKNQIIAGNLDIVLQYSKDGSTWTDVDGATDLFDPNALWEPGHAEYVYLKVDNAGKLDLKYKMNVNISSETGSINQAGKAFKLSDYLVFGKIDMGETLTPYANRADAVAAAGTTMGLSSWTKADTLMDDGNPQYVALVVYMPTSVGNEANYRTGEAAPRIELGVNVVATQLNSESDSFGIDYDENADGTPDNAAAWTMPAFRAAASVPADAATAGMTIVKTENDDPSAAKLASIAIPATVASGFATTDTVTLSVTPAAVPASVTVGENQAAFNYDIKLMKTSSTSPAETPITSTTDAMTVELNVGKGLSGVKIFHTSGSTTDEISGVSYDPATGIATFTTKSFSDYTVVYTAKVVTVSGDILVTVDGETTAYNVADFEAEAATWTAGTYVDPVNGWDISADGGPFNADYVALCHAFWAASNGLGNVETSIVLNKDLNTEGKYYSDIFRSDELGTFTQYGHTAMKYYAEIPNVTLDLNGHMINMNAASSAGSAISVYNANLTIKDSVGGGGISSHCYSTVCHLGNTVITIEGGTLTTDAVNGRYHGMAIMSGGDYVENATADGYMPGQIKLTGGTMTFDYMDGNGGTVDKPATVKDHYSSYPSRYEGYDENTPIGVFYYLEDGEIPAGYTYQDNGNGTFTVIPAA